jgi:hypothetical protein
VETNTAKNDQALFLIASVNTLEIRDWIMDVSIDPIAVHLRISDRRASAYRAV